METENIVFKNFENKKKNLSLKKKLFKWGKERQKFEAQTLESLQNGFGAIRDIKIFNVVNFFTKIFDKSNFSIERIKLIEDFNKNSLENNNKIYTMYSKDVLKKEENTIKQSNYKKIFLVQTDNLNFISNTLVNEADIDLISNEFFSLRGDSQAKYFLNKKINLKNPYSIQPENFSYLDNINYFFKNVINLSIIEFKAIIKQSIPETAPIYYAETYLKIFNN